MMKNNISRIVKKYLSDRFSAETEEKVQRWLIEDKNTEDKESASIEYWDSLDVAPNSNTYSALDRVNQRIGYSQKQAIKVPLYKKLSGVAAVLIPLFMAIGGYLYYESTQNNIVEVYAAYGEEKHLFLPDSSEIWINAGTTIKYPKEFKGNERNIQLDGEAYFSVRKNESKPFIVETSNLSVKVLGTKFNVKAYSNDSQIIATLTSGKVEVIAKKKSQILKPNEQLVYSRNTSTIYVEEILSNETDGWLNGQLIFNNSSLEEILKILERRFNVSISNKTAISVTNLYTVKFLKNENLDDILTILGEIVKFKHQREGEQIIINNAN